MSYYRYNRSERDPVATLIALGLAVLAVVGITFLSREAKSEVARKPPLVSIMNKRAHRCRDGDEIDAEIPQQQRIALVFENTKSKTLDMLIEKGITVCADSRLAHQDTSIFE